MYWNSDNSNGEGCDNTLNSNIRCIEIFLYWIIPGKISCWIVTLDVLKSCSSRWFFIWACRWIVTLDVLKCKLIKESSYNPEGWIVTLDVLKLYSWVYRYNSITLNSNIRCIEILTYFIPFQRNTQLNSNIRCIEIINNMGNYTGAVVE